MSLSNILRLTSSILGEVGERSQIVSLSRLEGEMKYRIFNKGLATDGSAMGAYRSAQYKKERLAKGRQVGYKDLEFYSDLRNSIQQGKSGSSNVLGFTNDRARLIAGYQQEARQTGKIIFEPSQAEINLMLETHNDEISFALKKGLSNV
jgi:hypothetical protein